MTIDLLLILGGLVLLVIGGELFVRGSVQIAQRLGLSPLLIGLTLVGFGTSTPELVASVQAALTGSPGVAVGNVVGSNIYNIFIILGLSALIVPIRTQSRALKRDGVIVIASAALLAGLSFVTELTRAVGIGFVVLLIAYLAYAYFQERVAGTIEHTAAFERGHALEDVVTHTGGGAAAAQTTAAAGLFVSLTTCLGGLAVVILGGVWLVDGAIRLARDLGVSEAVIGLTIVAAGTSMPELVTSVIAAWRKHTDVALGNVLGSNIYNILGIGGATALIAPIPVPESIIWFDNFVMIGASLLLLLFAATGLRIGRREGAVFIACYAAYLFVLWPK